MQTRTPWITLAVLLLAIVGVGCAQPSPTAAPTAVPPPTEKRPTDSEMRAPKTTLLNMSRPMLSVPKRWDQDGLSVGAPVETAPTR